MLSETVLLQLSLEDLIPNGTYDVTYNIIEYMNAFNVNHVYIVPLHVSQVDASPKLASCIAVVTVPKSN